MGKDGSRRVVERVAAALERIGDGQQRADAAPASRTETDLHSADAPAMTDGGADDAPAGESPWSADDPIVFGEESDSGQGAAILDAVTDESAPPFGDEAAEEPAAPEDAHEGIDDQRLDELEERIGALESDHVHLESQLTDVEHALTALRDDVDRVGEDVAELVTVLGGITLATAAVDGTELDASAIAAELADEIEPTAVESEGIAGASSGRDAGGGEPPVDGSESDAPAPESAPGDSDGCSGNADTEPATSTDDRPEPDDDFPTGQAPDGIHRGAGSDPESPVQAVPDTIGDESSRAPSADAPDDADASSPGADSVAEMESPSSTADAEPAASGDPSRELVDPRTEAVGARLRQFREGFVDDPTADLPTGNLADEFRFEKVLLPTDGQAAPDLQTDELAKPYLEALPEGYAADAVVLEWLDWLVTAADGEAAARAIGYYESIDWLTGDARERLLGYLDGLGERGDVDAATTVREPPAALDLQDHLRSLQYVTELATGEVGADGV